MMRADFDQLCKDICIHCQSGLVAKFRPETREYVHSKNTGTGMSITICFASHFRVKHQDSLDG